MDRCVEIEAKYLKEASIAPFAILRIGCLPSSVLQAFVKSDLSQGLDDYIQSRNRLWEFGGKLVDELELLVKRADTSEQRHKLIRLKRDIHNRRPFVVEDDLREWLRSNAPGFALAAWQDLQAATGKLLQRLTNESNRAFDVIDNVLSECWENPLFRQGVTAASPSLSTRMSPDWRSFKSKKRRGISGSLFAYVTRAAAKTSPFSTLTSSCYLPLDTFRGKSQFKVKDLIVTSKSTLNRSIPAALRNALILRHASRLPLRFHLNPHAVIDGGKVFCFSQRYLPAFGIVWSSQQPLTLTLAPGVEEILKGLPKEFPWARLEQSLQQLGISAAEATQTVHELMRRDIIRSELEWEADCENPVLLLADLLGRCDLDEIMSDFRAALLSIDKIASSFTATPLVDRPKAIREIVTLYTNLHGRLSSLAPPEIRTVIHEDSWSGGVELQTGTGFSSVFQRIGKAIEDKLSVSDMYIWLRGVFIERYGEGGTCEDVGPFITDAWRQLEKIMRPGANRNNPRSDSVYDPFAGVPLDHVRVPMTVHVQVVGKSLEELDHPDCKIVINLCHSRIGWNSVRFCDSTDQSAQSLQSRMRIWLKEVCAPKVPVSLSASAESSNLQAHLRCTDQRLILDGAVGAEDLKMSDLVLRHNCATHLLELTTRDGLPIHPNYLGGVLPAPLAVWGPRYLIILIGEPVAIRRPSEHLPDDADLKSVIHQKRHEEFGCVLSRETWWTKSDKLLERLEKKSAVECLIACQDFRHEFGIPRYVYAKGQIVSWELSGPIRRIKPIWVDFHNVSCLEQLVALAKDFEWLILTEALPGPGQNVLKIQNQEYVSEFLFEMVFSGSRKTNVNHNS